VLFEEERDNFYVDRVRTQASALAKTLREATEAGVSHAVILPQLILVFRDAFGEMPAAVGELLAAAASTDAP
jgi:hypothetical protein